jgi:ABC-type transporter Mla subunit MlaD
VSEAVVGPGAQGTESVRLRYMAAQAEDFTETLDGLRVRFAQPGDDTRSLSALLDQAADAARDLAVSTRRAADLVSQLPDRSLS